jgi:hypothetical protein
VHQLPLMLLLPLPLLLQPLQLLLHETVHSHLLASLVLALRVLDVHAICNCQTHPLGCASF